eukprot:TRINITY_DN1644_c0_g1_i3.p1 TRINITY_DN1644_c0_g1~~TRINITY_DN1644_c0_g1_i3.p1  ORF type:complete len:241 (+),score=54.57 TRINITY_DN1644_c0_g1_i3:566-1288(+)
MAKQAQATGARRMCSSTPASNAIVLKTYAKEGWTELLRLPIVCLWLDVPRQPATVLQALLPAGARPFSEAHPLREIGPECSEAELAGLVQALLETPDAVFAAGQRRIVSDWVPYEVRAGAIAKLVRGDWQNALPPHTFWIEPSPSGRGLASFSYGCTSVRPPGPVFFSCTHAHTGAALFSHLAAHLAFLDTHPHFSVFGFVDPALQGEAKRAAAALYPQQTPAQIAAQTDDGLVLLEARL